MAVDEVVVGAVRLRAVGDGHERGGHVVDRGHLQVEVEFGGQPELDAALDHPGGEVGGERRAAAGVAEHAPGAVEVDREAPLAAQLHEALGGPAWSARSR